MTLSQKFKQIKETITHALKEQPGLTYLEIAAIPSFKYVAPIGIELAVKELTKDGIIVYKAGKYFINPQTIN